MRKINLFLIPLLVFILGISGACTSEKNENANPAYHFKLTTLSGETVTLDSYQGKVLLVDMWDTWCPPCKAEIPHFVELYNEYNDKGLEILGVAFGREGENAVRQFVDDYNVNYPNAIGNQEIVEGFGGIRAIPTTFIIDQKGNIHKKLVGYNDKETFETLIKQLL